MLAERHFGGMERKFAQEWLDDVDRDAARGEALADKEIDRSISLDANRISRRALAVSAFSAAISGLALAVAIYALRR